jgi:hypothetical protein
MSVTVPRMKLNTGWKYQNTIINKVTSKMITYLDPGIELPMLNVFESTQGVVTGNSDKGPQCTVP